MARIAGATFQMGSVDADGNGDEHPSHKVEVAGLCIDETEVTVKAYQACVAAGTCSAAPTEVSWKGIKDAERSRWSGLCNGNRSDRASHPVNCVDWDQARAYCAWAGKRLPTEAEWELAAKGTTNRTYPWGGDAPSAKRVNGCGAECSAMAKRLALGDWKAMYPDDDGWEGTSPAGTLASGATPAGVYDLAGNVAEWTADWYGPYVKDDARNPSGPSEGTARVGRGGSFSEFNASALRTTARAKFAPSIHFYGLGFRCAK